MKDGSIDSDSPVDAYWLDIDPEYQKKNRKKGKEDDRVELGFAERNMAYGFASPSHDTSTRVPCAWTHPPTLCALCVTILQAKRQGQRRWHLHGHVAGPQVAPAGHVAG